MKDRTSVEYGDTTIEYEITRSGRRTKTLEIMVSRDGVRVYAPWAASDRELRDFVQQRAPWIIDRLALLKPINFIDGETLPYLGRDIPMLFEASDVPVPEIRLNQDCLRVTERADEPADSRTETISRAFVAWYNARAWEWIPANVDLWWPVLGRGCRSAVLIRNQRKRWASCAADGTLRFNWRVIMLDPDLIEYVVVHELAHLTIKKHPPAFWNLVRQVIPDVQERRRRLTRLEPTLPLWTA